MISFKLFLENQRRLQERRTIPLNASDPIEKNFEEKLDKDYDFADNIIRWYKNSKKEKMDSAELTSIYKTNLDNLIDLLNEYKECVKKIKAAGKKTLKVNVKTRQGTKSYGINDINEFNFLDIAQNFIKAVCDEAAKLSTVSTGKSKYQITNEDAKKIYLLDFSNNVALWVTEGPDRDTTNKLVYQLWNNVEDADSKMDRGDVWGNPNDFSPYCTHSKLHWDGYSKKAYKGDPKNYKQFWYLKKIPEVNYAKGDLTNKSVQKIFAKMNGTGAKTLICMNDSIDEMLDKFDKKVRDLSKLEFGNEIKELQNTNLRKLSLNEYEDNLEITYENDGFKSNQNAYVFIKDKIPSELKNRKLNVNQDIEINGYPKVFKGSIKIASKEGYEEFIQQSKNLKTVEGNFTFANRNIKKLKYVPEIITGNFKCANCDSLESLEGAPKEVGGNFDCSSCYSLKSLKGAPEKVKGHFACYSCSSLESFEGGPKIVKECFWGFDCRNLKSLEGAPIKVGGFFECSSSESLLSLEGAPKEIGDAFRCSHCRSLKSLEGVPKEIKGDFDCSYCDSLESLEGAPKIVKGDFNCSHCNSIKSFKDKPKQIGGKFIS